MKRILFVFALIALPLTFINAQKKTIKKANEATAAWEYELEQINTGLNSGSVIVKVWSTSKKPEVATDQAKKNAIHGAIFKGIPEADRLPSKRPLEKDPDGYNKNEAFYEEFFGTGGAYMQFVTLTNKGMLDAEDILKISKKEYKVGVQVTINHSGLRKYLEQKGIIKKLSSGF